MGRRLADALADVGGVGVVHRDVKPANLLLERGLHPRLVDFAIARGLDRTATTANGPIVGAAAYLATEQVCGPPVGPPTDVYALGPVVLEAQTARTRALGEGRPRPRSPGCTAPLGCQTSSPSIRTGCYGR